MHITKAIQELKTAAAELERELGTVRQALAVLDRKTRTRSGRTREARLSKAGRDAISKAAKQRWREYRRSKKSKAKG